MAELFLLLAQQSVYYKLMQLSWRDETTLSYQTYNNRKRPHFAEACNGTGAMLSGDEGGLIWMSTPLYQNNLYCQWHIKVEAGKVSFSYSLYVLYYKTKQLFPHDLKTVR